MILVPLKGHRLLNLAQAQWQDEPAAQRQLLEPRRRNIPGARGEHDAIERRPFGISIAAIGTAHVDAIEPRGGEMLPRCNHHVLVDIDGDDLSGLADEMRDERGVIAGAGTNLEDALARLQRELFEHDRHDRRLRRGTDRPPVRVLGRERPIGVDIIDSHARQEDMPGHRAEGSLDGGGSNKASRFEAVD